MFWTRGLLAVGLTTAFATLATVDDHLRLDQLPRTVAESVKKECPKATFVSAEKELNGDGSLYDVDLREGTRDIDMHLNADGTIVRIQREIGVDELPQAVRDAVKARYPNATLSDAESIRRGTSTHYELDAHDGPTQHDLTVTPSGEIVVDTLDD